MKRTSLLMLVLLSSSAFAESEQKLTTQQSRMATCSHDSKGMKADERNRFLSDCLKGQPAEGRTARHVVAAGELPQPQGRMKSCNADAGKRDLHGDERRAFMSACLKG